MKTNIVLLLTLFMFFSLACNEGTKDSISKQENSKEEVKKYIYSYLKDNNIDKRVKPIIYQIDEIDGLLSIKIESTMNEEIKKLENDLKERFENISVMTESLPEEKLGDKTFGIIDLSVGNMRSAAKHSAELVSQTLLGTPVRVYKKVSYWHLIQTPDNYLGWIDGTALHLTGEDEFEKWTQAEKIVYMRHYGFAYKNTNADGDVVGDLVIGDMLKLIGEDNDFYEVQYPNGTNAFVRKSESKKYDQWLADAQPTPENLVATAERFMGLPYLWGGTSAKGLDCSGFTKTVYFINGIVLQRDASQQTLYGEDVDTKDGFDNLQVGDLLFFGEKDHDRITHVAMYIGDTEFIHASGKVRINSVSADRDNYAEGYMKNFVRAKRYITAIDTECIEKVSNNKFYTGSTIE